MCRWKRRKAALKPMFDFEKTGEGRYEVHLVDPGTRLGMVLGKAGDWRAETRKGCQLPISFGTRKEAANALLSHLNIQQKH